MKAYVVLGGLLVGMAGIACGSSAGFPCEQVSDCVDQSCPSGQELFCNLELSVCDCARGAGGSGGGGGSAGTGGAGGTGGLGSCFVGTECDLLGINDCDTPCRGFCGSGGFGNESYGTCGGTFDPSQPPPDTYYCYCYCGTEECP
ncbi:MAG: hypothetical protein WBM46_09330 [Polyangiales bacterium]|jgi:hypothetical protein